MKVRWGSGRSELGLSQVNLKTLNNTRGLELELFLFFGFHHHKLSGHQEGLEGGTIGGPEGVL